MSRRRHNPAMDTKKIIALVAVGGAIAYYLFSRKSDAPQLPEGTGTGSEPTADKTEQPALEQPATQQPATEQPATQQPTGTRPTLTFGQPKTGQGVIRLTSNVPGGIPYINSVKIFEASVPVVPKTFDYKVPGAVDGSVEIEVIIAFPDGKKSVPMKLTVAPGTTTTLRLDPEGYAGQSYYSRVAEASKDTATIERNSLMDRALTAANNKNWVIAAEYYDQVASKYPGTAEARAAAVTSSIIKAKPEYKASAASKDI
jgi:hypothetical protein